MGGLMAPAREALVTPAVRATLMAMPGLIVPEDGEALYAMAADVPAGQSIIEIGAHRGLSSCWLASGARDGHGAAVVSIDLWPDDGPDETPTEPWAERGALERWWANMASIGAEAWSVRASGTEAAAAWPGTPVGMLFHDADHSFAGVRDDYLAWLPFLAPGCWVAVHDYYGAVPDGSGGWRRVGVLQAAVAQVIVPSGSWSDVRVLGEPFGGARTTPNLWMGRRG